MSVKMKRLLLLALCGALVLGCNKDPEVNPPAPDKPDTPDTPSSDKPQPGTYKFILPDSSGKTAWETGDEIFVHGGYTPSGVTVKLSGSDISADGKTATVNMQKVPDSVYGPDKFYAAYPAGLIDMDENFCDDAANFTGTDAALMCAWLDKDTFKFENLCGTIKFTVDGDWDGIVFRSTTWIYSWFESFGATANSQDQNFKAKRGNGGYFLNKDNKDGSFTLFFPGVIYFTEGFKIHVRKGDTYPKVYTYSKDLTLKRNDVLDLGNITSKLTDYDGAAPKDQDMPKMGKSTKMEIPAVDELSGLCLNKDKTALFGAGDDGCLGIINFDGSVPKTWKPSSSCGMEDVTIDPATGDLYVADEDAHRVVRIKAADYANTSSSTIPFKEVIKVQEAVDGHYGNSGIEGVTYYKDNILFVGSQTGANLWKYTTSGEKLWKVSLQELSAGSIKEVGGLCYDSKNNWLWVIDSERQKIFVLDEEITHILAEYPVRFAGNCESVCVDPDHNCVWVGDDADSVSRLFKIEFEGL